MPIDSKYSKSVFINCPYDKDYIELQQVMMFVIMLTGLNPRLAAENTDCSNIRFQIIKEIIASCKYSIHDLSRLVAKNAGEYSRMNMPFELGLDCGCKEYSDDAQLAEKVVLVLGKEKYGYQKALSDFAGIDISAHHGKLEKLIEVLRGWLLDTVDAITRFPGGRTIWNWYFADFHYFMKQEADEDLLSEKEIWACSVSQFKNYISKFLLQFEPARKYRYFE